MIRGEATVPDTAMTTSGRFEIRSEAHGPHWVAWFTRPGSDGKPERSVVIVGETCDVAETKAREWAAQAGL